MSDAETVRSLLQTCECGSTWWETRRRIQIYNRESVVGRRWPTAHGAEPVAHQSVTVIVCADCGTPAR